MPNLLELFGEEVKEKGSIEGTLFNFFREIPLNPFDEIFEVRDRKGKLVYTITKKGMSIALFNAMIDQINIKNKKDKEEADKAKRKK